MISFRSAVPTDHFTYTLQEHLGTGPIMVDEIAALARQMNVIDAIVRELERQRVIDVLSEFDVTALAKVVMKAADGDVIPFPLKAPEVSP